MLSNGCSKKQNEIFKFTVSLALLTGELDIE